MDLTSFMRVQVVTQLRKIIGQLMGKKVNSGWSPAINEAFREKTAHWGRGRLAESCAKLNPETEQALADEGLLRDLKKWSKY
jgi:hypothetical protein